MMIKNPKLIKMNFCSKQFHDCHHGSIVNKSSLWSIEDDCHHRIVVNKSSLWSIEDILKSHHGTILIHFRWLWSNLGILSFGNLLLEKVFEKFRAAPRVCVFLSNKPVSSGHFVMNTVRVSTVIWSSRVESHCILLALCSGIIRLIHSKSKVALLKLEVLFLEMHA